MNSFPPCPSCPGHRCTRGHATVGLDTWACVAVGRFVGTWPLDTRARVGTCAWTRAAVGTRGHVGSGHVWLVVSRGHGHGPRAPRGPCGHGHVGRGHVWFNNALCDETQTRYDERTNTLRQQTNALRQTMSYKQKRCDKANALRQNKIALRLKKMRYESNIGLRRNIALR